MEQNLLPDSWCFDRRHFSVEKSQHFYWVTSPECMYKRIEYFIYHYKLFQMKKLLTVTLVGMLAACGSNSSSTTTDSTTVRTDSSMTVRDSTRSMTDTSMRMTDSMKMDSTRK